MAMEITPPMVQVQVLELLRAGWPRTMTVGEPGAHGPAVAGTQGVGTPDAAEVSTVQVPNGKMFVAGIESMMLAAGFTSPVTFGAGTASAEGAEPCVHWSWAPIVTSWGIGESFPC